MYFCENDKSMGENHLTYFKIENFKRFDSFEMENLGQFNLLVGDNNVGKTSVLEGLCFDIDGLVYLKYLFFLSFYRKLVTEKKEILNENYWKLIFKDTKLPVSISFGDKAQQQNIKLEIIPNLNIGVNDWAIMTSKGQDKNPIFFKQGLRFVFNKKQTNFFPLHDVTIQELSADETIFIPFIPINTGYDADLLHFYYEQINANKSTRKEFEEHLKSFIPKFEEIRTQKFFNDTEILGIVLEDENGIYPITRFGDGTIKLTRILLEILMAKGNLLMIDEIENGIHFSRLKDFWKTVITLCKQFDVQLFATTHSLECQRYFVEALSELGEEYQKDARNISLLENAKGEVKSVTFDFEQFEFALEIGYNTRGGVR